MFSIGQLAQAAAVSVETVRYYERLNLIEQPRKPAAGYRRYPEVTLNRIYFIKRAQNLGFTLEEIASLLTLNDAPCREVQDLTSRKLTNIRAKIADLRRLEMVLNDLLNRCSANSDQTCCPVIDSLLPENKRPSEL